MTQPSCLLQLNRCYTARPVRATPTKPFSPSRLWAGSDEDGHEPWKLRFALCLGRHRLGRGQRRDVVDDLGGPEHASVPVAPCAHEPCTPAFGEQFGVFDRDYALCAILGTSDCEYGRLVRSAAVAHAVGYSEPLTAVKALALTARALMGRGRQLRILRGGCAGWLSTWRGPGSGVCVPRRELWPG